MLTPTEHAIIRQLVIVHSNRGGMRSEGRSFITPAVDHRPMRLATE